MLNRTVHAGLVTVAAAAIAILAAPGAPVTAQEAERRTDCPDCAPSNALSAEPRVFHTQEQTFRVVPMKGLNRPWALEFLPNGDMLITEHGGQLRIVRDGVLDPEPLGGIPEVFTPRRKGLMDIALHPRFEQNQFVYFTYHKASPDSRMAGTPVLARGKFEGRGALVEVRDLFVSDAAYSGTAQTARVLFGPDGKVYMVIGVPLRNAVGKAESAQDRADHAGKVLRLNEDGSAPHDNPFAGREGYRREIYALGIRNALGLFVHPDTGQIWETENGPMGGDEVNIIEAGRNYGWPVVSYGRDYTGNKLGGLSGTTSEHPWAPGMEEPFAFWNPSPALAGITFYTGDRFPTWTGNAFIAAMGRGSLGTRQLHRIVFNRQGRVQRNGTRTLLAELEQRIRDVRQGPDGLLYLTTDEPDGAVLRIEPVESSP